MSCLICERLEKIKKREDLFFIKEFSNSVLVLGDHQYFPGYSQLFLKECVRDLNEMDPKIRPAFFEELMEATELLNEHFKPYRFNYSSQGNVVEHVHFHIIPRYKDELNSVANKNPWANSNQFQQISPVEASEIISRFK